MRRFIVYAITAGAIGALLAFSSAPSFAKTVAECNADYAANKEAIKASGQTKKAYVAACRAGTAPATATSPSAPAPAPAPTAAAAPAQAPVPQIPTPAPMRPKPHVVATGGGGFTTDAQARAHCPADAVVWVNTKSGIYHFAGTHNYGTTKQGAYMCEADAKVRGDRAAENERHP
jgi:hypothetical protein